jgi:alpha-galactosidase
MTNILSQNVKTFTQYVVFSGCLLIMLLTIPRLLHAQKNPNLALSPPMGWNSWNWHGKQDINEQVVRETIDAIVNEGLRDAGYVYVIVDGGWRDTKTGPNGELLPHPVKFPNGMKALADYAHSKGLKFGLHTVPGTHDCGGDPVGGFNREEVHVKQFVEWGLDFIKLDMCIQKEEPCTTCETNFFGWSEETIKKTYIKWSQLLNTCGRDILFSISAYDFRDWYPEYCNMARSSQDILARVYKKPAFFNSPARENKGYLSVMAIAELNNKSAYAAGNGFWNDPDMMVTGNQGLTEEEQKSHFALWCIMTAPLMLGNDTRSMSKAEKELVTNREMIGVGMDPSEQGKLFKNTDNTQVWVKNLSNGKTAILLLNLDTAGNRNVSINLKELGIKGKVYVRDIIDQKDLGTFKKTISQTLGTNHCGFFVLSK